LTLGLAGGVSSGEVTLLGATSGSTVLACGVTGGGSLTATTGVTIQAGSGNIILMGIGGTLYVEQFTTYLHYGSGIAIGWASTTATGNTADTGISRIAAGVMGIGNGTAGNIAGNLELNRVNIAGIDQAGTATVTAAGTSVVVNYAANYTGTAAPVVVVTPTSDPLASGVPVGYWVVANGGAGAWTGFGRKHHLQLHRYGQSIKETEMIAGLLTTFRHELVSTVLVTAFLGALMYPFKKIVAAYKETQTTLKGINEELANQRNNCLTTLQTQGDKQIVLLTSAVDVLREMHTDTKIMLDRLGRS
jgi:hypothetical protein